MTSLADRIADDVSASQSARRPRPLSRAVSSALT